MEPGAVIRRLAPAAIFAFVLLVLWVLNGSRLELGTNDEGIYLDGAQRLVRGEKLYLDFFGYMSPGSYWAQEAFFRVFGVTRRAGRLPVLVYFAAQCSLLYWITARLASPAAGLAVVFFYFAFQTAASSFLTAQHRWDSATLSLGAIALWMNGFERRRASWFAGAGVLLGMAVFVTPSMAYLCAAGAVFLLATREMRRFFLAYAAGGAAAAALAGGALAAGGIFGAFVDQMFWLSKNYATANRMSYGSVIGGYPALFEDASGGELAVRAGVVACVALPAILPILSLGWLRLWRRLDRERSLILY
ncbi:MAG: ArnT family glycosyltransferase, partial [Bryobacteraceae bacterium]